MPPTEVVARGGGTVSRSQTALSRPSGQKKRRSFSQVFDNIQRWTTSDQNDRRPKTFSEGRTGKGGRDRGWAVRALRELRHAKERARETGKRREGREERMAVPVQKCFMKIIISLHEEYL